MLRLKYLVDSGLTFADNGTINVMGVDMTPSRNFIAEPYMMGYCDHITSLIEDLTVEEHFIMYIDVGNKKSKFCVLFKT